MRIPSVKMMKSRGFTHDEAVKVRKRMEKLRDLPYKGRYHHFSFDVVDCLEDISRIIGGFGCEYNKAGTNKKSPEFEYVNTGDSYSTTILYYNGNFHCHDQGFLIEYGNYE